MWKGLTSVQFAVARKWPATRRAELTDEEAGWIKDAQRLDALRKCLVIATTCIFAATTVFAGWQWHLAEEQAKIAESRRLASAADAVRPESLDLAMLLTVEAIKAHNTLEARGSLQRCFNTSPEIVRFIHLPEEAMLAVGPSGQIAVDHPDRVTVFDHQGKEQWSEALNDSKNIVSSLIFREDKLLVGVPGTPSVIFTYSLDGQRLDDTPLEVGGETVAVMPLALGPDGQSAAAVDKGMSVMIFDPHGRRTGSWPVPSGSGFVRCLAFGIDGRLDVGLGTHGDDDISFAEGGVISLDANGRQLRPAASEEPGDGAPFEISSGPNGEIAAVYDDEGNDAARIDYVNVFDSDGDRFTAGELVIQGGEANTAAFTSKGELAVGFGREGVGGIAIFEHEFGQFRRAPLDLQVGSVTSIACGANGTFAAIYKSRSSTGLIVVDLLKRRH